MGITMKFTQILPLAAASSAFVLPSQEQLQDVAIEANHRGQELYGDALKEKNELLESFKQHYEDVEDTTKSAWSDFYKSSKSVIDDAFDYASETADGLKDKAYDTSSQVESWLRTEGDDLYDSFDDHHDGPPHHGPLTMVVLTIPRTTVRPTRQSTSSLLRASTLPSLRS